MYRLILVDDEAIVREGISSCLPWGKNGFKLTGMFEHGKQALEYIEKNSVDVVLTDINMPKMNGLELSRIISENYPKITVLLLSGYDDFEYAQEAVKNQVRDFLLKPITADELQEVLLRIQQELDLSREKERQQELMRERLEESLPLLRQRFLYRLISGRISRENIIRRISQFHLVDLAAFYQVTVLSLPESWDDLDALTLSEYLKTELISGDEIFSNREEDIVVLLQGQKPEELEERSRILAEKAFKHTSRLEKDQITAGCGEAVNSLYALPNSYRGACNILDYSKVLGISQIISIKDIRSRKRISLEGFYTKTREFTEAMKTGSEPASKKALEDIFTFFESHYLTMSEAAGYLARLHFIMIQFLLEMDLLNTTEKDPLFEPPGSFGSLTQARLYFNKVLEKLQDIIRARRHDIVLSRVDKARRIIGQRYRDSSFSLKDICDELFLSTSQFSLLFKEGTGQTFVEYLTAFRVDEAKKLLKTTDLKGYEVAEKTGFSDPRYFSIVFKKLTGLTAMEYRKGIAE